LNSALANTCFSEFPVFFPQLKAAPSVLEIIHKDQPGFIRSQTGPRDFTTDTFEEFAFMSKKKDKTTESKKNNDTKPKGESFLDNLRPTAIMEKAETLRGSGSSKVDNKAAKNDKTKKIAAGGIVAAALGALVLAGLNFSSSSEDTAVTKDAPAAVVSKQPARAASEAAAASMLPQPLAPQKARLAEPTKKSTEVAKPSKTSTNKKDKLAKKTKGKDSVKKSVAKTKKQKATKKSKKTLAAKSID
jgi:hypothetical protein